jgi:hypothetical protein
MNNNISRRRRKKNKEKKDLSSVDNKVPKEQKITTITKANVMDMSAGIIDIDDIPDVATWNKEIHIKGDGAGIITVNNRLHEAKTTPLPPTTVGIHLIQKKGSKKDLVIDPADKKQVDEAIKSGSTLTDGADLS